MTDLTGPAAAPPTCYRHPDRETYVRCTRCDRPICPDCMVAASVGFQCPECVADGNRTVRQARTVGGGRVAVRQGVVTRTIVAICAVVFAAEMLTGGVNGTVARKLELLGVEVAAGEYYRLITVMFVHASILHILFNMYALWVVGPALEGWLGRLRFGALYLLAGIGGSTASYVFNSPVQPSVGASGAIFGVFGATLVVAHRMRYDIRWLLGLIVINLLLPVLVPGTIDWRAHVGGLVVGMALGALFAYPSGALRVPITVIGCLVVLLVCGLLVQQRTQQIRNDPTFGPIVRMIQQQGGLPGG